MKTDPVRLILLLAVVVLGAAQGRDVDITTVGAVANAATPATAVIQKAIDEVAGAGGGTVIIPTGKFITAPIQLRSHVTLRLERGAVLAYTDNPADARGARAFVLAEDCEDVGIEGPGTIDGNGRVFEQRDSAPGRPNLVCLRNCRDAVIRNVTLRNAGSWTCRLLGCDGVRIHAVRIYSHQGYNNDGIDIDGRNIAISDCIIDCDDDAICFKSDSPTPCENVTVTNCVAASNCNLIKMGTASFGGFKNITVSNCSLHAASEDNRRQWKKKHEGIALDTTGISGIALEIVDGGVMDQVCFTNITMTGIQTPVFLRLGERRNPAGALRNVIISNITATTESLISSSITGIPGHFVENVILRDIIVHVLGQGTTAHASRAVPEKEKSYPENRMFGDSLPAYGLFVRHANGVTLDNVQFRLRNADARPAIVLDDAHDIELRHLRADPPAGGAPLLRAVGSSRVLVSGFRTAQPLKQFAEIAGNARDAVKFLDNDFAGVERVSNLEPR